jgi:hypothetical protein
MSAFVTGVCISSRRGSVDPAEETMDPWRDTGVEIHGPAVAALEEGVRRCLAGVRGACAAEG